MAIATVRQRRRRRQSTTFPDAIVATGKGFVIKRSELDAAFISYSTSVAANGGSIPESDRNEVKSKLLDHLVLTQILTQKATPDEKAKVKKMVDDNIDTARKAAPSPAIFDEQLKASGMTLDQVRKRAYEEQLAKRVLEHETTNGITISDADAKKFYDENPDKFEVPEQVHVAHILISTLEPADPSIPAPSQTRCRPIKRRPRKNWPATSGPALTKARTSANWSKVFRDPGSKDHGGEYTFPRGRMVPEFEAAAFSLKTNQISDLVETRYGYHIIKLLEKIPGQARASSPKSKLESKVI